MDLARAPISIPTSLNALPGRTTISDWLPQYFGYETISLSNHYYGRKNAKQRKRAQEFGQRNLLRKM